MDANLSVNFGQITLPQIIFIAIVMISFGYVIFNWLSCQIWRMTHTPKAFEHAKDSMTSDDIHDMEVERNVERFYFRNYQDCMPVLDRRIANKVAVQVRYNNSLLGRAYNKQYRTQK